MTATTFPARLARANPLERLLAVRITLRWEFALYAAIFAAAFALRFWDLGDRALHHDESIHAQWSWRLLQGDYTHSPIFHGPFYYHVQGAVFFLFGTSDYTSRISAAIFGTAIVAMPLLLRRWLGPVGTLAAVALLAFSPTVVYYSRFFREDIYMAFFVLVMVAAMWRYMAEGRQRWFFVFALGFTGAVTTKEGAFLTIAVFLVYLDVLLATRFAQQTLAARDLDTPGRRFVVTGAYAPWAWILASFWPLIGGLRERFDLKEFPRSADMLVLLGTLTLPLLTPVLREPLEALGIVDKNIPLANGEFTSRLDWQDHLLPNITTGDRFLLFGLFALTTSAAAFVGLQWRPKVWAIAFGTSALIYLTLMTSFWTNLDGLVSGPWGSLDYWSEQQGEYRGDQPWYYYDLLLPAYEFLPLVIAIGGAWWSLVRGDAFSRFLWVWLIGQLLALSWGSEKMPWLNTHLAIPACLLAAWTLQRAWQAWRDRPAANLVVRTLGAMALLGCAVLLLVAYLPGDLAWHAVRVGLAVVLVGAAFVVIRRFGWSSTGAVAGATAVGALAFFSLNTMRLASFERGDVPKDMLIYTQSSPDIPSLMADIDRLAEATGKGQYLPIAVDAADSFAWPWVWYLRDYKCVNYPDLRAGELGLSNCQGEQQPYAVVLVNQANVSKLTDTLTDPETGVYGPGRRYPHRWWFDETYKSAVRVNGEPCTAQAGDCGPWSLDTWKTIAEGVFQDGWPRTWFFYWRDHDPDKLSDATGERACNTCGSIDGYAYFPANYDVETGELLVGPVDPPKPGTDAAGRPTFGGAGSQPGQFFSPVDIAADAEGNLFVIDSASKRLQKFDAAGNLVDWVDVRTVAGDRNEASQPWGLAIAPGGEIVVADTFGWRVRVFDQQLGQISVFGDTPDVESGAPPGDLDLFGPRDVAVDGRGHVWITDTGHDRLVVTTLTGESVRTVGSEGSGPGQFNEPVGIDVGPDGLVYVADMFNGRVVVLDGDGNYLREFAVDGWGGQGVEDKPYLTVLGDGRIVAGLPSRDLVRIYGNDGAVLGEIDAADDPVRKPYGLAEAPDGKLWIVEGGASRVRQFTLP